MLMPAIGKLRALDSRKQGARLCSMRMQMENWIEAQDRLSKTYKFQSFEDAMMFMLRVSYIAASMDHHPEWKNIYNKVFVELTTHDADGVTELDHKLAAAMDEAFEGFRK